MWFLSRMGGLSLAAILLLAAPLACGAQGDKGAEDRPAAVSGDSAAASREAPEASRAADALPAGGEGAVQPSPPSGDEAGGVAGVRGPGELWAEIQEKRNAIGGMIRAGNLESIHEAAEGLDALGEALLHASSMLDEAKRVRVQGAVSQLGRLADNLHDAADRGDAQATEAEFRKLEGLLKVIEVQYPQGMLSGASPRSGGDGHGRMEDEQGSAGDHHHAHQNVMDPADVPANAQRVAVTATDFRFDPQAFVVKAGVPVALTIDNRGKNEHAWVIAAQPEVHLHVPPGARQTQVFTVERPGRYKVACTVAGHEQLGMVGQITVQ